MNKVYVSHPRKRALRLILNGETIAKFVKSGEIGTFYTDDEELQKKLESHPEYKQSFVEWQGGALPKFKGLARHGAVTAILEKMNVEREALKESFKEDYAQKYKRLGQLESKLKKNDGSYRADAESNEIKEFELLKNELGE